MTIQIALYLAASLFTFGVSYGLLQSKSKQLLKQIEEHKKEIDMLKQHTVTQQTRLAVMEEKANSILKQIDIFQDQTKEGFTELKRLVVQSLKK
jgi:septal ring factor EnvC (AmiA/AmiB activator)